MSNKVSRLSRQKSIMVVENNPLEAAEKSIVISKVENLTHATLIPNEEITSIRKKLETFS
jgi:hypothetical protein